MSATRPPIHISEMSILISDKDAITNLIKEHLRLAKQTRGIKEENWHFHRANIWTDWFHILENKGLPSLDHFETQNSAVYPRYILDKMLILKDITQHQYEIMVRRSHIVKEENIIDCLEPIKDIFEVPTKIGEE